MVYLDTPVIVNWCNSYQLFVGTISLFNGVFGIKLTNIFSILLRFCSLTLRNW